MKCNRCGGKGFIESYIGVNASFTPSLEQCPARCDIGAYSREVQRRLSNPQYGVEYQAMRQAQAEARESQAQAQAMTHGFVVNRGATVIPFRRKHDGKT
jgi:hypothetical protein